jgi:hypothetical protein
MRIRKHQPRGNAGGESSSGAQRTDPGSREQSELALSSRGVKEKPDETVQTDRSPAGVEGPDEGSGPGGRPEVPRGIERVDSTSRSAFTWLDKLRHSKGFTELEPYSNLEDFVSSLTKKDDGRGSTHSEEIVEGGDMSRLVGGVDLLQAHQLMRHSSVCSESSSKHLNVGSSRPALEPYAGSSVPAPLADGNERFNVQLQRDANLPSAAERSKDRVDAVTDKSSDASGAPSEPGPEVLLRWLKKDVKHKGQDHRSHKQSPSYWGEQARNTSWMRDNLESSEVERAYGESSGKKDFAGNAANTGFWTLVYYVS